MHLWWNKSSIRRRPGGWSLATWNGERTSYDQRKAESGATWVTRKECEYCLHILCTSWRRTCKPGGFFYTGSQFFHIHPKFLNSNIDCTGCSGMIVQKSLLNTLASLCERKYTFRLKRRKKRPIFKYRWKYKGKSQKFTRHIFFALISRHFTSFFPFFVLYKFWRSQMINLKLWQGFSADLSIFLCKTFCLIYVHLLVDWPSGS